MPTQAVKISALRPPQDENVIARIDVCITLNKSQLVKKII